MLHRALQIVTGVLLGLAFVAVLVRAGLLTSRDTPATLSHEIRAVPFDAPPLTLPSVNGTSFDLAEHRGEVVLVFFGFANCPDVCPATLAYWSRALEELGSRDLAFTGVFVSVDPGRDTPEALARWMTHFHPDLVALTGHPDEIERTAEAWDVYVSIHPGASDAHAGHSQAAHAEEVSPDLHVDHESTAGETYMVDHSSRTFVVDRQGQVVRTLLPYIDGPAIAEILLPLLTP